MKTFSLHSPALTTVPSTLSRNGFVEKSFLCDQTLKLPYLRRHPCARKLKFLDFRASAAVLKLPYLRRLPHVPESSKFLDFRAGAAGTTKIRSEVVEAIPKKTDPKDEGLAFVAGATGKVGSRTVRELLKLGFRVRAGVRSAQKAETLVESVKQMKFDFGNGSEGSQPVEKLEILECDLEKRDQIGPALGNASVVLCCIGASEKEVFDITGPYRIDYQATKNLIDAATVAKVNHFILVSSLGTNKFGFPAAILNLFWGVLIWKRKAEEALIASGLPYTIVRPGGMERPTDAYKETHNITLSQEDTLFGGQVSNLQVAELMSFMAKNRGLSYCKVVEVIAETTAPLTPTEELLTKIPSQRADTYTTRESDSARGPDAAPPKSIVVSEAISPPTEKEPAQEKAAVTRPLSPYFVYDDLKPPTSPTPTQPSSQKENINILEAALKPNSSATQTASPGTASASNETKVDPANVQKMRPLSPYAVFEDLKPPSSPSPAPSGPKETPFSPSKLAEEVLPSIGGNDVAKITAADVAEKDPPHDLTSYRSPYPVYEDLKPPTTPTPSPKKST